MGFRLSVQPLLPIGKGSLIYGSNDGGESYQSTHEEAKKIMEAVGRNLYLKTHICQDKEGGKHTIVGPADIEVHQGGDGHIYAIDAARLMPPDLNIEKPNSIFYQHFRPEFMKCYKKPLNSDAYSRFGILGKEIHNKEALEASRVLREERVPKFASTLKIPADKEQNLNWVGSEMRRKGINAR